MAALRGILIVITIVLFGIAGIIPHLMGWVETKKWLMMRCFSTMLFLLRVSVTAEGGPSPLRPLLIVSNHSSYLDIPVLGSRVPVSFTPKSEIGNWPLIGSICRLIDCVFIDRRVSRTAENRADLRRAIGKGCIISLFPEGTTSDSRRVLPFRSSYFSLAEERFDGQLVYVQPVAISYPRVCGLPMDSVLRPKVAWYGDMALVPHVADFLRLGPVTARLTFLPAVTINGFENRKALALHCENAIAESLHKP